MKTKSLFQKLLICLLAGLVCGETFLRVGDRFLSWLLPLPVVIGISVLLLATSLLYAVVWHVREKKSASRSLNIHAFWIAALRYGIAFDLAMFGFQKIFYLQFTTPLAMLDEPFSSLSSQWLTWSYFGHSHSFACVIGTSQILGSFLLLFNRTRLLAVITLIPILLNIIFIDYFYELDFGVMLHALILLAGVIYLLCLDYDRLVDFFLHHRSDDTAYHVSSMFVKGMARLSIIVIPLVLIFIFRSMHKVPSFRGKYAVSDVIINGKSFESMACQDSVLTLVYFDRADECVFEFGDHTKRLFGTFDLSGQQEGISVTWHFPPAARNNHSKGCFIKKAMPNLHCQV